MALNITSRKADELTRKFAQMEGVSLSDAIAIAMQEAIDRRRQAEPIEDTVNRVLKKHGIVPSPTAHQPLPKQVFDDMWGDRMDDET